VKLEKAIFKASRGNAVIYCNCVEEADAEKTQKIVFVVYIQAGADAYLVQQVKKVCLAFMANLYDWPTNARMAALRQAALEQRKKEQSVVLEGHRRLMKAELDELIAPATEGSNSKIEDYRLFCMKEKSILDVMNMSRTDASLQITVWYPVSEQKNIEAALKSIDSADKGILVSRDSAPAGSMPPTYIRSNDFTAPWQEVVDTYGIPKYQEANPAVFTTITFPFIFGMMYGDIGHGTLLFCFGLFLVMKADDFKYSQPVLYMIRYMVVSMGFFAVFAGFMYNDLFAMALPMFQSRFHSLNSGPAESPQHDDWQPNHNPPWQDPMGPYPFGLDWAWEGATNQLVFVNSLKMKLSVLFGVMQMTVGVLLRWSNAFYWKSPVDFICECIPMMVFMVCFFGWMDWMILYKWTHFIDAPPSIINSLICMAMGQEDTMPLWEGSTDIAKLFMKLSMLAVPIMLLPKPLILLAQHKKEEKKKKALQEAGGHELLHDEEAGGGHGHGHGHGEFEFGEVFIHQVIETIEYVLGTVSHTASYLRIWALSLAHQQLSAVFFEKTLLMGLSMSYPFNGIALYILFTIWFAVTLGVLLGMDVLECFLHTLRLHWVEFQSKFYNSGGEGGIKFAPYDMRKLIEEADE
jgi:V-type H+-transporting ATPase subunit a